MIYFGTKNYMQWVEDFVVDVDAGKSGWANRADFMNGGTWVRRSKAASKNYTLSWNMRTREQVQPILDYADGVYGNGYIYFSNPMWMDKNVLPAYWAQPYMNYYDGPVVVGGVRPTITNLNTSTNGYPVEAAVYTLSSTNVSPTVFIPIPTGYTAHVGAHGSLGSGSAGVRVTPEISAIASGTPVDLTLMPVATTQRTNATFSGDTNVGITLSLRSASTGTLILNGLIVQILPNGQSPQPGGFISGQGQSGMEFVEQPKVSEYSAAFGTLGMSAKLVETEAWSFAG